MHGLQRDEERSEYHAVHDKEVENFRQEKLIPCENEQTKPFVRLADDEEIKEEC